MLTSLESNIHVAFRKQDGQPAFSFNATEGKRQKRALKIYKKFNFERLSNQESL